jgi:hypothetical protein
VPAGCWPAKSIKQRLVGTTHKTRRQASCCFVVRAPVPIYASLPIRRRLCGNIAGAWGCRLRTVKAMTFRSDAAGNLLWGTVLDQAGGLPLSVLSLLPDLRPRFMAKGKVGRGYRAIARNGRVLMASDRNLAELAGEISLVRLQAWHRSILPREPRRPYGLLLVVQRVLPTSGAEVPYTVRLVDVAKVQSDLVLNVGGCKVLEFVQPPPH